MVGGKAEVLAKMQPVLEAMGKSITHVGDIGSGQVTKAINQTILAGIYSSVAEGMVLGMAAGVDIYAALQAVSGGAAGCWVLNNRAKNMIEDDYPLGFRTKLFLKDLGIALETSKALGVSMPVAAYVEQLGTSLVKRGLGDEDVSNLARIVREQAGLTESGD
jgi:3-hydroxyisobutyrate dehydrogenase